MAKNNSAQIDITARDLTKEAFASVSSSLEKLNRTAEVTKNLFVGGLVGGLAGAGLKEVVTRTIEAERTQNQLAVTLKATGYAAGVTTKELSEMGEALSKSTAFDDDDIKKAEVALLRFRDIQGSVFKSALSASLDVATAKQISAASGAEVLGRALENPARGLRSLSDIGVIFTQRQQDMIQKFIETGNVAAAQKVILDEVAKSIGGAAAGDNAGLYGSTTAVTKAWDDLLKTMGKSSVVQVPVSNSLGFITNALKLLGDAISEIDSPKLGKLLDDVAGVSAKTQKEVDPEKAKAAAGQAAQDKIRQQEAARLAEQRRLQEQAAIANAVFQKEVQAERQKDAAITTLLDAYYNRGLISIADYYKERQAIAEHGAEQEKAAIQKVIAAQQALLNSQSTKEEQKPAIKADIARLQAQSETIDLNTANLAIKAQEEKTDATDAYLDKVKEVNAALLEQQGELAAAAAIRFDVANRKQTPEFKNNSADEALLGQLRQRTISQAELNQSIRDTGILRDQEANKESAVQNKLIRGQITELQALKQTDDVRRASIDTLQKAADEQERIAKATGDPQAIQNVQNLKQAIEDLAASSDQVGQKFRSLFSDSLTDPFADFITGAKSAEDALKDFASNVERALARIAAQNIAEQIFGAGTAGGGAADFVGQIFSSGFAKGGIMTSRGPLPLMSYAGGGIASRPQLALFGEGRQNEAYVPLPDGKRIPVDLKGGGGGGVVVNMTVVAQDANSFRRSGGQITTELARGAQQALRRA